MGAAWYLPAWLEDTDLTIHSKPAFLLWLLYRGAGCNITPVAKRIVYFTNGHPSNNVYEQPISRPLPTPAHPRHALKVANDRLSPNYKFHSLAINDGSSNDWPSQNREVLVNYVGALQPAHKPGMTHSQYKEICYTHVIPRSTPPHTLPITEQHLMSQGCPGLDHPVETVSPPRTVSMLAHDGRQRPMVETQIYSVYPMRNSATAFRHALDSDPTPARSTQTDGRGGASLGVLVNTDESLPMIHTNDERQVGVVADECMSHYWYATSESYPELPSVSDFQAAPNQRRQQAVYVYNQSATQDTTGGFRNAVTHADTSRGMRDRGRYEDDGHDPRQPGFVQRYASYFQLPMIYFYHY